MAVQTSFPKGATFDIQDTSKVKYLAAKSLICRVFRKVDVALFCVSVKFSHNLFSNDFLKSCLIKFFFIKVF